MVTLKKHTTAAKELAKAGRYMRNSIVQSRFKKLDTSSNSGVGKTSLMQLKTVRRTDQRSTFSINCSSGAATGSTGGRTAQTRSGVTAASPLELVRRPPAAATGGGRRLLTRKSASGGGGGGGGGGGSGSGSVGLPDFARTNSGVSNSIGGGAVSPTKATMADEAPPIDTPRQARSGRKSNGTCRGKTVSITASQDGRTLSSRMFMASNSEVPPMKRSIIKLRPLPAGNLIAGHNEEATSREVKPAAGLTPHQIKEQKIFGECRFIPCDTFYKKVLVAPRQERQFFAAPKCSRVHGTRFLYDIAGENWRHHQDVNFDFTRDSLRRACASYLRPSYFRHNY